MIGLYFEDQVGYCLSPFFFRPADSSFYYLFVDVFTFCSLQDCNLQLFAITIGILHFCICNDNTCNLLFCHCKIAYQRAIAFLNCTLCVGVRLSWCDN